MNELIEKLKHLMTEAEFLVNKYTKALNDVEAIAKAQENLAHQLKGEKLSIQEREAKIQGVEITLAEKKQIQEDRKRIHDELQSLEEKKMEFNSYKDGELAKLKEVRETGDLQQRSLNEQKEQLAKDRENYKAEVRKEVAKEQKR